MKTILVLAAAMGLSISAASAECVGHKQVNASVDTETKVASVVEAGTACRGRAICDGRRDQGRVSLRLTTAARHNPAAHPLSCSLILSLTMGEAIGANGAA